MICNLGYFWAKFLKLINRPAIRNTIVDKTAHIGGGSNCINVSIGRYTYLGKNNSLVDVEVGAFCSIASYCAIGGGGHEIKAVSTSPVFFKGHNALGKNFSDIEVKKTKKVKIGNDVWIGEGVFICEGVTIGNGSIIGAHSVVTHNVEPYTIVAGVPAKVLRKRFSMNIIERLQEIAWWNWPEEKIERFGRYFISPEELIKEECEGTKK